MHTVIIMNEHSSDLLKDFKFIFQPFLDKKLISFCPWNESGTDIKSSVPDLYNLIKGKQEWRAVIVSTDSMRENTSEIVANEKNPFDFIKEKSDDYDPKESKIPYVRLSHMLCGYPNKIVKKFVKGFEYVDINTGKVVRVAESDLTESEISNLSKIYNSGLKSIYLEEKYPEEVERAHKELVEKYSFTDIRPREVIFIATRRHFVDEEKIYNSWKSNLEIESSNFCARNNYPTSCRFMCYSITNPENSVYLKELFKFWLSILMVSVNKIPASSLQAYRLYSVNVQLSKEEFGKALNKHINKSEAAYNFVQSQIALKSEYSFDEDEEMVPHQNIPVNFNGSSGENLYINTNRAGICRDIPKDELIYWNYEVAEKTREIDKYLKKPRRAIDKSAQYLKDRANSFYGDEYELDKFQVEDLKEKMESLESNVLESTVKGMIDERKTKEELKKIDGEVKKDIDVHIRSSKVLVMGIIALVSYFVGYLPNIIRSFFISMPTFLISLGIVVSILILMVLGGIGSLMVLRKRIKNSMERFNKRIKEMVLQVNEIGKTFESYFSTICTYMKSQSVYAGIRLKSESISSGKALMRTHKSALKMSIERDTELLTVFGIKREQEFERNVTSFFDITKFPKDNRLYYYEVNKKGVDVPLNDSGELVGAPYKFIERLDIIREDIFEETKGENY